MQPSENIKLSKETAQHKDIQGGGGKILLFFGKHSMNLWLVHSFFIFYFLNGISFITNSPLVMFITVLGCSLLCSIIIELIKSKIHI